MDSGQGSALDETFRVCSLLVCPKAKVADMNRDRDGQNHSNAAPAIRNRVERTGQRLACGQSLVRYRNVH